MQTLEQLQTKHEAELAALKAQHAAIAECGEIPGLTHHWATREFRGFFGLGFRPRGESYSQLDGEPGALAEFLDWAEANALLIDEHLSSRYQSRFMPSPFDDEDYDKGLGATGGQVIVKTANGNRMTLIVFYGRFEVSVEVGLRHALLPVPTYRSYSPRYYGKRAIEGWRLPDVDCLAGRMGWWSGDTDWRGAEYLMTIEQLRGVLSC